MMHLSPFWNALCVFHNGGRAEAWRSTPTAAASSRLPAIQRRSRACPELPVVFNSIAQSRRLLFNSKRMMRSAAAEAYLG
jgi:hypothetical protein